MVQPALLEKLEDLSEALQSEVLQYVELLLQGKKLSQLVQAPEKLEPKAQHGYGSWEGEITMSDDFDEPLEDLNNFQMSPYIFVSVGQYPSQYGEREILS